MSESPTERPVGRDGEVLDYVDRKGPITANRIVEECGVWSPDEVYTSLRSLERDGFVESQEGDLSDHGTTRRVWYVDRGIDQDGGGP
jgi:predicted transcriptional regulator